MKNEIFTVFNLSSNETMQWDANTVPVYAVSYAYCQEHDKLNWFHALCRELKALEAYQELPIVYGKHSVCCGDWCTRIYE